MKKFLFTIVILLLSKTSFANVNVNNCDKLEKQSEKLNRMERLFCENIYERTISKQRGSFLTMIGPRNLVLDCHEKAWRPSYNKFSNKK